MNWELSQWKEKLESRSPGMQQKYPLSHGIAIILKYMICTYICQHDTMSGDFLTRCDRLEIWFLQDYVVSNWSILRDWSCLDPQRAILVSDSFFSCISDHLHRSPQRPMTIKWPWTYFIWPCIWHWPLIDHSVKNAATVLRFTRKYL